MKSPNKLKFSLFITGVALIAASMLLPGTALRTFAGPPLIITGSPTIPPPTVTPPATVITTPEERQLYGDPYVLKSTTSGEAMVGQTIDFVIVAGNKGTVNAVNVQVRDSLPAYLDLVSVTSSPRGTVIQSGNSFIVDIGDIAPGELITIKVSTRVNTNGKPGECVNVATLNTTSAGDNPNNNVAVAQCLIGQVVAPPTGGNQSDLSGLPLFTMALGALLIIISLFVRRRQSA